MKFHIGRRTRLSAVLVLMAALFTAWEWQWPIRLYIYNAVPAAAQHSEHAVPAPPDNAQEDSAADKFVSEEFMNYRCYQVGSLVNDPDNWGHGKSTNAARRVQPKSRGRGLYMLAQPNVVVPSPRGAEMRITLVNQTGQLLSFAATDSCLPIAQEAQDTDGNWKPIDHLPVAFCGNSIHRVFLAQNSYWAITAPRYKGSTPTQLRFTLMLEDGSQLHSNVFAGSINQDQFTSKPVPAANK
ncbi:MAG: repeat-containing protein [Planctomycetaceae bacterium]|nr:repeat-containing protein [Planctomycetaceae bacterium]